MATDNDENDRRKSRGNTDRPTRDTRGRWRKGHCPNPKGRPKKRPKMLPDQSNAYIFSNTMVDIVANGQKETMDRRTALLNKMFESAMKGKVSMQRFLYKEFEMKSERLTAARAYYQQLIMKWVVDNPDLCDHDYKMPTEVQLEILGLRATLNHYFGDQYPLDGIPGTNYGDDDDDDNG